MTTKQNRGYRPIRDYALIGDAHTAALVASDGSIDWCCWPSFDGPAVFLRLLDAHKGGWFRIGAAGEHTAKRRYAENTNVLETTFTAARGQFRLTDFMPVYRLQMSHKGEDIGSKYRILRLVEGISGEVEVELEFHPTFDYARAETAVEICDGGAVARGAGEALSLACPFRLKINSRNGVDGRFRIAAGERVWIVLRYFKETELMPPSFDLSEAENDLAQTVDYWREWCNTCKYEGPYRNMVERSALTLKLLTYEPTGAIIAAPTTSLPENIGGVRNWDYRYAWLRDASLILYALQRIGYSEEASDFFEWLEKLCLPCRDHLHIMYTIYGSAHLPEHTLDHLEGYRGSRPVRIGNAAVEQKQLDIYGAVVDAAHLYYERWRQPVRKEIWEMLSFLADEAAARWGETDEGIWEVRCEPEHFLYSKLLCWVALDRALRLAPLADGNSDLNNWRRARDEIAQAILTQGYNEKIGAFTQTFGSTHLDASALAIPLLGFLPATDPRVLSTIERIQEQLSANGLIYRYKIEDGLPGGEGAFALCSFWMVDNLALSGRVDDAHALFEQICSYANDLGLLSEEIDPDTGELLGNFPQGFTHLGLIESALNIAKAEKFGPEQRAESNCDRAAIEAR